MNRSLLSLLCLGFTLAITAPTAIADVAQMRELVPDVERTRAAERSYVFSRAQLKYGLEANDYLNRWVDRPLFVDPGMDDGERGRVNFPSFERIQQSYIDYGLDGMAFFPETSGRRLAYDYAKQTNRENFALLTEILSGNRKPSKSQVLEIALDHPASLRFGGKVFLSSYMADHAPVSYWVDTIAALKETHGDRFLFMPAITRFADISMSTWYKRFYANAVTEEDITKIKEGLREWLRATDGIYFSAVSSVRDANRRFDSVFYREFVIRIIRSVLAEEEFTGKYFGLQAMVGHENATRLGYTFDSDGTKTLRHSLATALEGEPDLIIIPEWDEQNENTSLRPTVYNGTSSQRILRYYMAQQRHTPLEPMAQDDRSIPNLTLSHRKLLTLGEEIQIELLHIPDGSEKLPFHAQLTLLNEVGDVVHEFPQVTFDRPDLQEHTLKIASEALADHRVLIPLLKVDTGKTQLEFSDGLHYLEVRPTWNWDYKWVKTPLRDLLRTEEVAFDVSPAAPDQTRMVTARFNTNEPLAYLEVLDNDDVVYSHNHGEEWHENDEQIILSLLWQSHHPTINLLPIPGEITLKGTKGKWKTFSGRTAPTINDQTLTDLKSGAWKHRVLVAIPRDEFAQGSLHFNLPGIYEGELKLSDLLKKEVFAVAGPEQFNFVASRYLRQYEMPHHLDTEAAEFTIPILPDLATSVLHLQAIGVSGKTYRSRPIALGTTAGKKQNIQVFSNTENRAITASVPAAILPDLHYQFDATNGSALLTDAGRPFWGILGGYNTQVTERGGGESGDGTPFINQEGYPEGAIQSAPIWVKDEGADVLQFDGVSTFVSLPQGVIPRRAGFTLEIEVKPQRSTGKQVIIAHRAHYPGSLIFYSDEGILKADFLGQNDSKKARDSGLALPENQWSTIRIHYDQNELSFEVNGEHSPKIPLLGPGAYEMTTVIGGYGTEWFKGQVKSLRIRHGY